MVDSSYHFVSIKMENPTEFFVESAPDWCQISGIMLSINANETGQTRTGEVVLKNSLGSAKITIVQEG